MPPRRSDTVEALLVGAERAFAERGFHGASIGFICQCAGRTTGAFYSNYDSKLQLLLDVCQRHGDRTAARIEERLAAVDPGPAGAKDLARAFADIISGAFDERWLSLSIEFRLMALRDGAAAAALVEQEDRFRRRVGGMLEELFARTGRRPALNGFELTTLLGAMTRGINLDRGLYSTGGTGEPVPFDTLVRAVESLLTAPDRQMSHGT